VPDVHDAVSIAVGLKASARTHVCATLGKGSVACSEVSINQGAKDKWKLDFSKPVEVAGVPSAVQVVAGEDFACARTKDGQIYCWGATGHGQLGATGPFCSSPVPVHVDGLEHVRALAASGVHACAVLEDGSVWCWGGTERSQPQPEVPAVVDTRPAQVAGADVVSYGEYEPGKPIGSGPAPSGPKALTSVQIARTTDVVPAKLGTVFGMQYRLHGQPFGEPVGVDVHVTHPPLQGPQGVYSEQTWHGTQILDVTIMGSGTGFAGWAFDTPELMAEGDWTFQVRRGDTVLAEKKLKVVAP
jgi:hypothetical protein